MSRCTLRLAPESPCRLMVGVGGIGTGLFFALEKNHTLGRNESRPARLLDVRDYCKLHIIAHYVSVLLGARPSGTSFRVLPIGKVGNDAAGQRLREEMTRAGMDARFVETTEKHPTLLSVCFQYPDGAGGNMASSNSANSSVTVRDVNRAKPLLASNYGRCIALAVPEVPLKIRHHLLKLATTHRAFRVASFTNGEIAAARDLKMFASIDLVALNEDEASTLAGKAFDAGKPQPFLRACATALTALQPEIRIVVTAGKKGAYAFADGSWDHCPSPTVPVASTAGAGDALLGGVIAALTAGIPLIQPGPPRKTLRDRPLNSALDFGVLLASLTVTSPHTIHPTANLDAMLEFANQLGVTFSKEMQHRFHS